MLPAVGDGVHNRQQARVRMYPGRPPRAVASGGGLSGAAAGAGPPRLRIGADTPAASRGLRAPKSGSRLAGPSLRLVALEWGSGLSVSGALSGLEAAAKAPNIRAAFLVRCRGAATVSAPPRFESAAAGSMRLSSLLAVIEGRTA